MRAFIGVEFPKKAKEKIINVQKIIRDKSIDGRWKYIDNFHLTFKFLGEVSEEQIENIYKNIEENFLTFKKFDINIGGLGYFKGEEALRVIYLDAKDLKGELKKASESIEDACFKAGIQKEKRRFTPHITVAQDVLLKCPFDEIKEEIDRMPSVNISVDEISIIKSEQIKGKRIYTPIKKVQLK